MVVCRRHEQTRPSGILYFGLNWSAMLLAVTPSLRRCLSCLGMMKRSLQWRATANERLGGIIRTMVPEIIMEASTYVERLETAVTVE